MEDLVEETLERFYADDNRYCKCYKCQLDVMTRVLNRMPPKYVVSLKGSAYTKLAGLEEQFKADVDREAVKALNAVARNPHH
jgi:competence protein ComFB